MGSGDQTNGSLDFCRCECGIPVTNKKEIKYSNAKDDEQLALHFTNMAKKQEKIFIGFQLVVAEDGDLDDYLFSDENHARAWLKQAFVVDGEYAIRLISYKKRKCCGEPWAIKVIKKMKPSFFLKTKQITKNGVIINLPE